MSIHLPPHIESSLQAAVHSGRFASMDDAMTEAAMLLLERLEANVPKKIPPSPAPHKPIWEVAADIRRSVPAEEWAKLPADGAQQLDHYLYGSPKRPNA